ncbi:MAG: putative alkaline phosphatase family protein [Streblomastix strix]|uniref:Protein HGH1 homolog n=1 Tax=Streblomastix strix TaxID=222440 RepID=A0A5J4V4Q0_9EUKA|nr:MAG: putative alkaline phosphatase family protein [Streblomastix strix]
MDDQAPIISVKSDSQSNNVQELINFLSDERENVRKIAIQYLLGISNDLKTQKLIADCALPRIWILRKDVPALAHDALILIVNMTAAKWSCIAFLNSVSNVEDCTTLCNEFIQQICSTDSKFRSLYALILSNLTRHSECLCRLFHTIGVRTSQTELQEHNKDFNQETDILHLVRCLLQQDMQYQKINSTEQSNDTESDNPSSWVATILMNISQLPECRAVLLQRSQHQQTQSDQHALLHQPLLIGNLLSFIRHPDVIKRGGVLGTLRNCLLETSEHERLLGQIHTNQKQQQQQGKQIIPSTQYDIIAWLLTAIVEKDGDYKQGELETEDGIRELPDILAKRIYVQGGKNKRIQRVINADKQTIDDELMDEEEKELLKQREEQMKQIQQQTRHNLSTGSGVYGWTSEIMTRETDKNIRLLVGQCLLLIASTRLGRDHLRFRGWAYPIIREFHIREINSSNSQDIGQKEEGSEEVFDVFSQVVDMIIRDEQDVNQEDIKLNQIGIQLDNVDNKLKNSDEITKEQKLEEKKTANEIKQGNKQVITQVEEQGMIRNFAVAENEKEHKIQLLFIPPPSNRQKSKNSNQNNEQQINTLRVPMNIPKEILGNGFPPNDYTKPTLVEIGLALKSIVEKKIPDQNQKVNRLIDLFTPPGVNEGKGRTLLFFFADALGMNLVRKMDKQSFIRSNLVDEIRAVFPSLTPCCITSFLTGTYPSQHGVMGRMYLNRYNILANPLMLIDHHSRKPLSQFGIESSEMFKLPTSMPSNTIYFLPQKMGNPQLGLIIDEDQNKTEQQQYPKLKYAPIDLRHYTTLESTINDLVTISEEFAQGNEIRLVYFYWPEIDDKEHVYGVYSQEAQNEIQKLQSTLDILATRMKSTTIVMTADHGQVDSPHNVHVDWKWPPIQVISDESNKTTDQKTIGQNINPCTIYMNKEDADLYYQRVNHLLSLLKCDQGGGDRRCCYFYCIDGHKDEFKIKFEELYGDRFVLISSDDAEAMQLFGPTPLSKLTRESCGDWICFPRNCSNHGWGHARHVAVHSGMSLDEMEIPLVVHHNTY